MNASKIQLSEGIFISLHVFCKYPLLLIFIICMLTMTGDVRHADRQFRFGKMNIFFGI
jgi:hypothetical protein